MLGFGDLHSTMYLLNPQPMQSLRKLQTFTFHYVSIKSDIKTKATISNVDLHSTMYLLNPNIVTSTVAATEFTFHYVSIKSVILTR